eukprot:4789442-Amphidinium_carterae.1
MMPESGNDNTGWDAKDANSWNSQLFTDPLALNLTRQVGVIRRGCPEALILVKLRECQTIARAPGPGPLRKEKWMEVGKPIPEVKRIILHTDSAKAYAIAFNQIRHTRVVHMKKKVAGKWLGPKYVEMETDSGTAICKAGTQVIDGYWKHLQRTVQYIMPSSDATMDEAVRT